MPVLKRKTKKVSEPPSEDYRLFLDVERPPAVPQFPANITELTDIDLRNLHFLVVRWIGFRQKELAAVKRKLMEFQISQKKKFAEVAFAHPAMEKWKTQAIFDKDADETGVAVEAHAKALELEIDRLNSCASAISREITFRVAELRV